MPKKTLFAERLQALMDERQLNQADLARMVFGEMVDERGYTVARNRQAFTKYLAGDTKPSEKTIRRLAKKLEVPYSYFIPADDPLSRPGSGVVMSMRPGGKVYLEISITCPIDVANDVVALVKDYAK